MRLLILGSTRFVGHAVAGAVLGRGWEVTTLNRGLSGPDLAGVRTVSSAGDNYAGCPLGPGNRNQVMHEEGNDGRFPDESPVQVRYPRSEQEEQGDR